MGPAGDDTAWSTACRSAKGLGARSGPGARHAYAEPPPDRPREVGAFLTCPPLIGAFQDAGTALRVRHWLLAEMALGERPWPVPPLAIVGDLGELVGFTTSTLRWFATVSPGRLGSDAVLRPPCRLPGGGRRPPACFAERCRPRPHATTSRSHRGSRMSSSSGRYRPSGSRSRP